VYGGNYKVLFSLFKKRKSPKKSYKLKLVATILPALTSEKVVIYEDTKD